MQHNPISILSDEIVMMGAVRTLTESDQGVEQVDDSIPHLQPAPPALALLPPGMIDFAYLATRAGSREGGRAMFEKLILALVGLDYPQVQNIRPMPGDWGIDGFVGELDDVVSIWQAKYFIDRFDTAQKTQITKSIKAALVAAKENGYQIEAWTLCVPVDLEGDALLWWTKLQRRMAKTEGLVCRLWSASTLERFLLRPDGEGIRKYFFPAEGDEAPLRPVQPLANAPQYDNSLFLVQLEAAGISQLDNARLEFFNAEILARDVLAKKDQSELEEFEAARSEIHSRWAHRFDHCCEADETSDRLVGLHSGVMTAIEDGYNGSPPALIRTRLIHHFGMAHQLCDEGQLGWVRSFEKIAADHDS